MKKRTFSTDFKIDSASLVVDKGYSIREAYEAVGVSESAMRDRVKQLQQERAGVTPNNKALTPEHQRIQELEAQIKRIEREKEILKNVGSTSLSQAR